MQESLGFQLVQEQTQKLVMNQEMRQAITILQYSSIELMDYIQRQMEENPLFEYEQNRTHSYTLPSHAYLDRTEFIPTQAESLEQTLLEQLSFANLTPKQIKIGQYLIGLIDADGYLREEITNIAQELRCSVNLVDDVLSIIQSFEPIGVGARNLNECLLIQLKHNGVCSPFLEDIITNHLNELAERKYAFLMDKYKVQKEELQKVLSLIEDINPRPGLSYSRADTKYVVPDVYVDLIDGELLVSLNDYIFPHLKINEGYRQLLHSKAMHRLSPIFKKSYGVHYG